MLASVADYGISNDAGVHHRWGKRLVRWYLSLGQEPRVTDDIDIAKYGGFCEVVTQGVVALLPLETFTARHVANLGFSFLAFLGAVSIARRLAGPPGGFFALLLLALTPPFYGHAFVNSKDIPFAAMFALAVAAILACDSWPDVPWRRTFLAGAVVGLTAAVRVGGLALFAFSLALWAAVLLARGGASGRPVRPSAREAADLLLKWAAGVAAGWAIMVAFWPWAMTSPLLNPLRALSRFSRYWEGVLLLYDGRLVPASEVSRFYLPNWFALTLPETYLLAALLGAIGLVLLLRSRPLSPSARLRLLQAFWLAAVPAALVGSVVVRRMLLYDGLRHFLFVIPLTAALGGTGVALFLRSPLSRAARAAGLLPLAAALLLTVADMARLHPYESVYFNRLWAGGVKEGVARYEGDYWCLSYKEGSEWVRRRVEGAACSERVRVAGHSVRQQIDHYLWRSEEDRKRFLPTLFPDGDPHYVMATTRFHDHLRTPGKLVFTVERMGATLLYLFEVKAPACEPAGP
jgi:hypothetical protein